MSPGTMFLWIFGGFMLFIIAIPMGGMLLSWWMHKRGMLE